MISYQLAIKPTMKKNENNVLTPSGLVTSYGFVKIIIGSGNGFCLFTATPLLESVLTYCQMDP